MGWDKGSHSGYLETLIWKQMIYVDENIKSK